MPQPFATPSHGYAWATPWSPPTAQVESPPDPFLMRLGEAEQRDAQTEQQLHAKLGTATRAPTASRASQPLAAPSHDYAWAKPWAPPTAQVQPSPDPAKLHRPGLAMTEALRTPRRTGLDRRFMQHQQIEQLPKPEPPPGQPVGWLVAPAQRNAHLLGTGLGQPQAHKATTSRAQQVQPWALSQKGGSIGGRVLTGSQARQAWRGQQSSIVFGTPTASDRERWLDREW